VGEQPDVESTNIHQSSGGTIIAGSGTQTVATDDEATVVEEKPATDKPKRVRRSKADAAKDDDAKAPTKAF
jgi:hypothetical protein